MLRCSSIFNVALLLNYYTQTEVTIRTALLLYLCFCTEVNNAFFNSVLPVQNFQSKRYCVRFEVMAVTAKIDVLGCDII
jgi:hypothetical protein